MWAKVKEWASEENVKIVCRKRSFMNLANIDWGATKCLILIGHWTTT